MATKTSQRIFIWFITVVMIIGTVVSFAVMIVASQNDRNDQSALREAQEKYQQDYQAYQAKVDAQGKRLSKQYYDSFAKYENRPAAFNAAAVKKLEKNDLVVGDGKKVTADSEFTAYYLGWNPTGKVFDGSIEGKELKAPITVTPGGVIAGWSEGVDGMRVGGVREITIPADKAYGEQGSGDNIPPNTPIKFVIMVVEPVKEIPEPEIPDLLLQQYYQ